jgi:hypothetical protein
VYARTTTPTQPNPTPPHDQTHLFKQLNRLGISTVLSADAQLDVGAGLPAAGDSQLDQLTHADKVNGLEGVQAQEAVLGVELQELGL